MQIKRLLRSALRRVGLQPIRTRPPLAYGHDTAFLERYERAKARTGTVGADDDLRRQRYYTLTQLVARAPLKGGDVCELGCWRGLSTYQIATQMAGSGASPTVHVFNSFQGLSQRQAIDWPSSRRGQGRRSRPEPCPLDAVQARLSEFPFISFYPGWIPERFNEVSSRAFALVHVDVCPGAKAAVDECRKHRGDPFFVALPSGRAFLIKKN